MELRDMEQRVLDAMKMAEEPLKTKEIADRAGVDDKETAKIIKKLSNTGMIYSPKRCYYELI